jgi:hypothetical protein
MVGLGFGGSEGKKDKKNQKQKRGRQATKHVRFRLVGFRNRVKRELFISCLVGI